MPNDSPVRRRIVPPPPRPPDPVLSYAQPAARPRKSLPVRAWRWVRYHVEDRLGNAIMFCVTVVGMMLLISILRPAILFYFIRLLAGTD